MPFMDQKSTISELAMARRFLGTGTHQARIVDLVFSVSTPFVHYLSGGALFRPWANGIDGNIYLALSNESDDLLRMFPQTYYVRRYVSYLSMRLFHNVFGLEVGYLVLHALCYALPIYLLLRVGRLSENVLASRLSVVFLVFTYWYGNIFTSDYIFFGVALASAAAIPIVEAVHSRWAWRVAGLLVVSAVSSYTPIAVFLVPPVAATIGTLICRYWRSIGRAKSLIVALVTGMCAGVVGIETVWRLWSDTKVSYWSVIVTVSKGMVLERGMRDWFVEFGDGIQARPHFTIPIVVSIVSILATSLEWRSGRNGYRQQSSLGIFVSFTNVTSWLVIVSLYRSGSGVFGSDYTFDPIVVLVALNLVYIIGVVHRENRLNYASNRVAALITFLAMLPWLAIDVTIPNNTMFQILVVASGCGIAIMVVTRTQETSQRSGVRLLTAPAVLTAFFVSVTVLNNPGTQFERSLELARRDVFKNRSVVVEFQNWVTSATGGEYTTFWYDPANTLMTTSQSSFLWGWTIATFQSSPTSPKLQIAMDEPLLDNSENASYVVAMSPDRTELRKGIKDICPNALGDAISSPSFSGYQGEFFAMAIRGETLAACLRNLGET